MCLAVPAQIVEVRGDQAMADLHGNRLRINLSLLPDAIVGDWVLIHAGFALQRLDDAEVKQTWAVLADLNDAGQEGSSS